MMALTHDKQLQMRVSDEFLHSIDEWRRRQPDLPSRAEAIRRLISAGLGAMGTRGGPRSGGGSPGGARKPRSTGKSR